MEPNEGRYVPTPKDRAKIFSAKSRRRTLRIIARIAYFMIVVLVLLRKRLFLNMFTDLFAGIIQTDKTTDNWKSLLLAIVRNLRNTLDA